MMRFENLHDLKFYSHDLGKTIKSLGFTINKYEPFMNVLGGDVIIVDEWQEMDTVMKSLGKAIDVVAPSKEGYYMTVCQITNNAGGHTYCFPMDMWKKWLAEQSAEYIDFIYSFLFRGE